VEEYYLNLGYAGYARHFSLYLVSVKEDIDMLITMVVQHRFKLAAEKGEIPGVSRASW